MRGANNKNIEMEFYDSVNRQRQEGVFQYRREDKVSCSLERCFILHRPGLQQGVVHHQSLSL